MVGAFFRLAIALQAEMLVMKQLAHLHRANGVMFPRQFRRQGPCTLADPAQRRFRIPPRSRLDQSIQGRQQAGVAFRNPLAARARPSDTPLRKWHTLGNLVQSLCDRHAGHPARPLHRAHSAVSQRPRFIGRNQTPRSLIKQGPDADQLLLKPPVLCLHDKTIATSVSDVQVIYERRLTGLSLFDRSNGFFRHLEC